MKTDTLTVIEYCECCEEPIPAGQEYVHPEEGDSYCRRCVIDLLGAERDALTRQLAGAVATLKRIAYNGDWWRHAGPAARTTLDELGLGRTS